MFNKSAKLLSAVFLVSSLCMISLGCGFSKEDDGSETVATPVFTPANNTFTQARLIQILSDTPNAKIYYTLNGSDPVSNQAGTTRYTVPIPLDAMHPDLIIRAYAKFGGMTASSISSAEYHLEYDRNTASGTLPTPVISPPGGIFTPSEIQAGAQLTISCEDPSADIYYYYTDFDGLLPTPFENPTIPAVQVDESGAIAYPYFNAYYEGFRGTKLYTGPIQVPAKATRLHYYLKAVALRSGYADSSIAKSHFRKSGFPTVESFVQSSSISRVGDKIDLDLTIKDDTDIMDGGLSQIRLSVRVTGHGTTNPGRDSEMIYFEYSVPNESFPQPDPTKFKISSEGTETTVSFGTGADVVSTYYTVYPSDCTVTNDTGSRRLTLHFSMSPREAAYDPVDLWKNKKSLWCWIGDDQISSSKYSNNPVTELGRWEITNP